MTQRVIGSIFLLSAVALTGCGNNFGFAQSQNERIAGAGAQDATDDEAVENFEAEDAKSPMVKFLLETLKDVEDQGSEEERKLIKRILFDADEELAQSLGDNPRKKITAANKRREAFRIHTRDAMPDVDSIRRQLDAERVEREADERTPRTDGSASNEREAEDSREQTSGDRVAE